MTSSLYSVKNIYTISKKTYNNTDMILVSQKRSNIENMKLKIMLVILVLVLLQI